MEDAGFILGSYFLTFATVALFAGVHGSVGRKLGQQVPDDEKYWL